jgi:hypothetical protein
MGHLLITMNVINTCLVTFLSGATVEGICAKWVKSVADKKAFKSGVLSCIWAIALLTGMEHALQLGWPAVTWVIGYGVGSYVAVKLEP